MIAKLKKTTLYVFLLLIPVMANSYTGIPDGTVQPTAHNEDFEWELVRLTNAFRDDLGLPPFKLNDNLVFSGRYHCIDMMEDDYFAPDTYDSGFIWMCSYYQRIQAYYPVAGAPGTIMANGFSKSF